MTEQKEASNMLLYPDVEHNDLGPFKQESMIKKMIKKIKAALDRRSEHKMAPYKSNNYIEKLCAVILAFLIVGVLFVLGRLVITTAIAFVPKIIEKLIIESLIFPSANTVVVPPIVSRRFGQDYETNEPYVDLAFPLEIEANSTYAFGLRSVEVTLWSKKDKHTIVSRIRHAYYPQFERRNSLQFVALVKVLLPYAEYPSIVECDSSRGHSVTVDLEVHLELGFGDFYTPSSTQKYDQRVLLCCTRGCPAVTPISKRNRLAGQHFKPESTRIDYFSSDI